MEENNNFDLPTPAMFLTANRRSREQLLENAKQIIFDQVNTMYLNDVSDATFKYMNLLNDSHVILELFKPHGNEDTSSISLLKFEFLGIIRDPLFPKEEFNTWLREHHWKLSCLVDRLSLIEVV